MDKKNDFIAACVKDVIQTINNYITNDLRDKNIGEILDFITSVHLSTLHFYLTKTGEVKPELKDHLEETMAKCAKLFGVFSLQRYTFTEH